MVLILITTLKVNGIERFKIRVKVTSSPGAQDRGKLSCGHLKCYWQGSHYFVLDGLFQLSFFFNILSVRSKCSTPRISFVGNVGRHRVHRQHNKAEFRCRTLLKCLRLKPAFTSGCGTYGAYLVDLCPPECHEHVVDVVLVLSLLLFKIYLF